MNEKKWISWRERYPELNKPVLCQVRHFGSGRVQEAWLIHVDEDDCDWRTSDDHSEISYDWDVLYWREE